jgi:hypothetical protein
MAFAGTLGPMAAARLNEFLERVYPWKIARGQIQRIDFDVRVRAGVASGTVTPHYRDLSIKVTGRGADGLLGTGGVIGDAARGVASAMARAKVNGRNPEAGKPASSGTVAYTFTQRETLVAFVWHSLRQGLLAIVRKE